MIEIAYRVTGLGWKRRMFDTSTQAERFVDALVERYGDIIEIRWVD